MKVLVIGDPHIKSDDIHESEQLIQRMVQIANQEKPNLIVVSGDILDRMDVANVRAHVTSTNLLRSLYPIASLLVLIGNHDLPSPKAYLSDQHFFTPLYEWPSTMVVDIQCKVFEIDGVKMAAVPYVANGRFQEALNSNPEYDPNVINIIFAHQQFIGCNMNGIISSTGDRWSSELPLVISGHIHQHQMINGVIYVGTPRQSSFRDTLDKSVSLFEISSQDNGGILSNGMYVFERRIPVGLPIKVKIVISVNQINTWVVPPNAKVKLEITGTHAEIAAAKEHCNIGIWKNQGIKVTYADIPNYSEVINYPQSIAHFDSFSKQYRNTISVDPDYVRLYDKYVLMTNVANMF